jgi:hypothetical protein
MKNAALVKPAISFLTSDPDPRLGATTETILNAMENNPNYPTPSPALPVVRASFDAYQAALAAAADGGVTLTSAKNARRNELVSLLRQLASYVQVACEGDMTKLLSSGFPVQKPSRQPIGLLPAPENLRVDLGVLTGSLDAKASPVAGASIYNWRVSAAEAPSAPLQIAQTTAARTTFDELTPGKTYIVEVNAVGTAGPSNWSNPVSQMAL